MNLLLLKLHYNVKPFSSVSFHIGDGRIEALKHIHEMDCYNKMFIFYATLMIKLLRLQSRMWIKPKKTEL